MFQIIGTNQVVHQTTRYNPQSRQVETIETVLLAGRVIAEHRTREITDKHCRKLQRCHKRVGFEVKERNQ